ncbi:MAG: serine/threonine-protein kinase [Kofleriaceae bacterium]
MSRAATALPPQTRLGGYRLLRLLAQGGMADIYLAQTADHRLCAVKVMSPNRVGDPDARQLFMDEGRVASMLDHENLAGVFEVAKEGHCFYLAMEFVHGADLREILAAAERASTALPYATATAIVAAAAAGLDHAHRRCSPDGKPLRLVHRDVSLSNVMVSHGGSVKVVDFGIAAASVSEHHTNPGVVRGKASYMSPEQALGEDVDLRTDVFALGVVLYELTTGRRCFAGASDFERMLAVVRGEYVLPSTIIANYPPALERVIKLALTVDRTKRYGSAAALLEALEALAELEGWELGTAPIVELMTELYGEAPDPFAAIATVEVSDSVIVDGNQDDDLAEIALPMQSAIPAQATVIITRPRRVALGTDSDLLDDVPTRGRRSLPAIFAPRVAA